MAHWTLFFAVVATLMAVTWAQGLNPYQGQGGQTLGGPLGATGQMGGQTGQQGQQGGFGNMMRSPWQTLMMSRWLDINPWLAMMFGGMGGQGGGNMMLPWLYAGMF